MLYKLQHTVVIIAMEKYQKAVTNIVINAFDVIIWPYIFKNMYK